MKWDGKNDGDLEWLFQFFLVQSNAKNWMNNSNYISTYQMGP